MNRIIIFLIAFFAIYWVAESKQAKKGETNEQNALVFSRAILSADSVCVNPSNSIKISNKLIKQTDKKVNNLSSSIEYKSYNVIDGEFSFLNPDALTSPINEKYDFISLEFEYSPKNAGWDTLTFRINYTLDGEKNSTDFNFIAYGVQTNISLVDAIGATLSNDTIYIDDTRVGDSHGFKIVLQNNSNFPYGINEQSILKEQINQNEDAFIFDKFFLPAAKHLAIGSNDTATLRFSPNDLKTYIGRIILSSDLNAREIHNLNEASRKSIFYIAAKGIAPIISISTDSIQFKSIEASPSCPTVIDTVFTIYNKGTQTLRLNNIKIDEEFSELPFQFDNSEIVIPPNSKHIFSLKLVTNNLDFDRLYNFTLYFKNNSINIPELRLPLSFTINRRHSLTLSVPKLKKARSGQLIEIPIIADREKIATASNFTAQFSYNKDILEYVSYSQSGTASIAANSTIVLDTGITSVFISCKVENNNFLSLDTLIKLRFRTYLAETNTSQLVLSNCTVGNEYCPNLYEINPINGEFVIDSIPGLNLKLQRNAVKPIVVKSLFPNPAFDKIFLNLSADDMHTVQIELLNSLSALVNKLSDVIIKKGSNSIAIDINQYPAGIYYLKLYYDSYTELLKFNIVK